MNAATAPMLRALDASLAEAVAAIDAQVNPSPWSAAAVRESLGGDRGIGAFGADAALLGFVLLRCVGDEAEILNIAVAPRLQRAGIGRQLLAAALATAAAAGATHCFLEVRASNRAAQALYQAAGFAPNGCRRQYYRTPDGREDAVLLRCALT